MNKNKLLITLVIIAYFVVLIGVMLLDANSVSGYIVYSNFESFKCKNLHCSSTTNAKISKLKKEKKMLSIYSDGEYIGNFYGDYNEKWNMFTEDGRLTVVPVGFIGISTSLNAQYTYLNNRELNEVEKQELDQILQEEEFSYNYQIVLNKAFDFDLNNDGVTDTIYCVSNFDYMEHIEHQFTILYTKINNKIDVIKYQYSNQDYELPLYDISGMIAINNQNMVMINESYFDQVANSYVYLYKVNKNKLSLISSISNHVVKNEQTKEEYIFNFDNEFTKKIIYIGIIAGIIIVVGGTSYLVIKKKQNEANQI